MKRIEFTLLVFVALCVAGCHSKHNSQHHAEEGHNHEVELDAHHDHDHDHDHSHDADHEHHDEIAFTIAQAADAHVQIETVTPSTFYGTIRTSGELRLSPQNQVVIASKVSGIIHLVSGKSVAGTQIKGGDAIATISARGMSGGDPVDIAKADYEVALREYERAVTLVQEQIISQREFDAITLRYENAKSAYQGQAALHNEDGVTIEADVDGFIQNVLVSEGAFVEAGEPIMVIARNDRLQLIAQLQQSSMNYLNSISGANFMTTFGNKSYSISELGGRLVAIGSSTQGGSSYIPVTFEFTNTPSLPAGIFVEVVLLTQEMDNVISVPMSSLLEEQGVYYVILRVHDEAYKKQEVTIGQNDGKRVEILSGLQSGAVVVTQGAYSIKAASAKSAIPGHTHNH